MDVFVDHDERYPDYYMTKYEDEVFARGKKVSVTELEWDEYCSACVEYNRWQNNLEALHNG